MNTIFSNKARRGLTLAEMLVAVAITVGLLLMIGMVFKSTTGAVGKGFAQNEICQQLRAFTRQLETDFAGLRPDMPFAIIFEQYLYNPDGINNNGDEYFVRQDRIVFFANGDFQTLDGISGNMTRIFYGQAIDPFVPNPDYPYVPPRQILTRRSKLLTMNLGTWNLINPVTAEIYDWIPVDINYTTMKGLTSSEWKNVPYNSYNGSTDYFFTQTRISSMVRRPYIDRVKQAINSGNVTPEALQQLFLLADVTDFKIQYWTYDPPPPDGRGVWRWFPDEYDFENFDLKYNIGRNLYGQNVLVFADAWNIPQALLPFGLYPIPPENVLWRCAQPGTASLPSAMKITFTLYDAGRRQFPQGQTYSYIVKLPQ